MSVPFAAFYAEKMKEEQAAKAAASTPELEEKLDSVSKNETEVDGADLEVEAVDEAVTEVENTEEPVKSSTLKSFEDIGFDVDGLTEDDIANQFKSAITAKRELEEQLAKERARLAELEKAATAKQPAAEPEAKVAQESLEDIVSNWTEIKPDEALIPLVEWNQETNSYVGAEKFGTAGVEAARNLNTVLRERNRRTELLISNPAAALKEMGVPNFVESKISKEIKALREELKREQQEMLVREQEQRQVSTEQDSINRFIESKKSELYVLDKNGNPKKSLTDQAPVFSKFGQSFKQEYTELLQGGMKPAAALEKAYKIVAAQKPVAEAPKKEPVVEAKEATAEKKKKFLDRGKDLPKEVVQATEQPKKEESREVRQKEGFAAFARRHPAFQAAVSGSGA